MGRTNKTRPLMIILEAFAQCDHAISLADLIERYQQQMDRTTVYRILQRLEDRGTLHSFRCDHGQKWFAKCKSCSDGKSMGKHPHFKCSNCGKIECLTLDISTISVPDYQVDSAELLLVGQCRDCLGQS